MSRVDRAGLSQVDSRAGLSQVDSCCSQFRGNCPPGAAGVGVNGIGAVGTAGAAGVGVEGMGAVGTAGAEGVGVNGIGAVGTLARRVSSNVSGVDRAGLSQVDSRV